MIHGIINNVRFEAFDDAGNQAIPKSFDIELDFVKPELTLNVNISEISKSRTLNLQGYVSEESLIQFYIDIEPFDKTTPEKVVDLEATTLPNSVDLSWGKVKQMISHIILFIDLEN